MIQDPIGPRAVDGLQVVCQVLDLAWNHRADSKDAAHAERLAGIPDGQQVFAHGISKTGSCPSTTCQQTQRTKGKETSNGEEGNRCRLADRCGQFLEQQVGSTTHQD